jgi:NAD(P)H-flavin reductase/ferredoxin
MPRVSFTRNQITYDAQDGEWLYDACQEVRASVPFACKAGACGTCATEVLQGQEYLGEPRAREIRTLEASNLDPKRYRLLCLVDVHGDLVLSDSVHAPQEKAALGIFDARVEAYLPLTQTVCEQRLRVDSPQFRFRPGQYMIFHVPEISRVIRRSYSISSAPTDTSHFEICVRAVSGGYCSNYVHRLRPGATIQVEGPYGEFSLEPESNSEILMVATGTGISPIKSMLLQLFERQTHRRIRLFFGLRNVSDLFYVDLLETFAASHPNFEPTHHENFY